MSAQTLEALALANTRRINGANQRNALIGKPMRDVVEAIIHPTDDLGCLRLKVLFTQHKRKGLIPALGPHKMERVFTELAGRYPYRRQGWNGDLRLRDLSELERRHLVRVLIEYAPKGWRAA